MSESQHQHLDITRNIVSVSRIEGSLLGAAIGDALGWPQERPRMRTDRPTRDGRNAAQVSFQTWERRTGGRFWSHVEIIKAGEYSDDTQLLLATARSLKHTDCWYRHFCWSELPAWLMYERGGGRATRAAAQQWQKGVPPWHDTGQDKSNLQKYFSAGGNGVAMRILPHALLQEQFPDLLCRQVLMNGMATHAHPRALLGAQLYGYAAWFAARLVGPLKFGVLIDHLLDKWQVWSKMPTLKSDYDEWFSVADQATSEDYSKAWLTVTEEVRAGLQICQTAMTRGALSIDRDVMKRLGCFDQRVSGAGTVSALAAVYLVSRYAADPVTGLLEAAFAQGADTDTIASMVGGLFGALQGREWIPSEWESIQDRRYLVELADSLAQVQPVEYASLEPYNGVWNNRLNARVLKELEAGESEVSVGPLGHCGVKNKIEHKPIAQSVVAHSWQLRTESGQTIYVKRIARRRPEHQTTPSKSPQVSVDLQRERFAHPAQRMLDPGIYVNLFEVILLEEQGDVMVAERNRFQDMRALRDNLKELDVSVYAWGDTVFGYGAQVDVLSNFGFISQTIALCDHPRLTERMILDGYVHSLEEASYTCQWSKGTARVYQFERPLFETRTGVRMFRGFELRGQFLWDAEHERIVFGIIIDAIFAYRDRDNRSLNAADVVARFGSGTLKQLRQKQGELSPRGDINLEVSRQRLLQQTLPFVDARYLFVLPCGVRAELSLIPTRVVLVDGELSE